jgi:hypothetical protein
MPIYGEKSEGASIIFTMNVNLWFGTHEIVQEVVEIEIYHFEISKKKLMLPLEKMSQIKDTYYTHDSTIV